jgi:hypothetical protein
MDNAHRSCPVINNEITMVSSVPVARQEIAFTMLRWGFSIMLIKCETSPHGILVGPVHQPGRHPVRDGLSLQPVWHS